MHSKLGHSICGLGLWGALLFVSALLPLNVRAQQTARWGALLEAWADGQRNAWDGVSFLAYTETVDWSVDSPFGARHVEAVVDVSGFPPERSWERDIRSARINGRRANARNRQQADNIWRAARMQSADFQALRDVAPRFLAGMRPASPPTVVLEDGRRYVRVEMIPRVRSAVERVTLWFEPELRRLLRSRAVVRLPSGRANFVIASEYRRVDELDIPIFRSIEGSYQSRRRMHEFTSLLSHETEFSDYRFEHGRESEQR